MSTRSNRKTRIAKHSAAFILAAVLAVTLAVSPASFAESAPQLFTSVPELAGSEIPAGAELLVQRNLHQETINNVEISVLEAAYDGRTLFLQYSFRMTDVDKPLGLTAAEEYGDQLPEELDPASYVDGVSEEGETLLYEHNVGWWADELWIDGKPLGDMPDGSSQSLTGTGVPGEIIETDVWRLDNVGVFLEGKVKISLPIGETPDDEEPEEDPDADSAEGDEPDDVLVVEYEDGEDDEDGMPLPEKGVVTFEFDTKDILSSVRVFRMEDETVLPEVTVSGQEAAFTPLRTYVRMNLAVNPDSLEAFIAENGEGPVDEDGELMWSYSGMDVFSIWLDSLQLVDGSGNFLFPEMSGPDMYSDEMAEFIFPYMETLPGAMYLAPAGEGGAADMSLAVPLFTAR